MNDINTGTPNGVLTAFLEAVDDFKHVVIVGLKKGEAAEIVVGHDSQHFHEVLGLLRMASILKEQELRDPESEE